MRSYRPLIIIGIVVVVAGVGTALLLRASRTRNSFAEVPRTSERPVPAGVVVTLEEFGDYQCPPCGALHPTLKKLKQDLGSNLNFVFRNFPLKAIHKNALVAAQAAEAARMQNHFWEMHDLLYENQNLWKDDVNPKSIFIKFAGDLGLDSARFVRDMADQQVQMRIEADEYAAAERGINGTPTVLIDGRQLRPEVTNPEGIRKGIDFVISHKPSPTP